MNRHFLINIATLALLLVAIGTMPSQARDKKGKPQKVYAFGAAESLNDTLLYLSPIQELQEAELDRSGFLNFREEYDAQLQSYLHTQHPGLETLCVTIYSTSRSKLEKKYLRLRREWSQRPHKRFTELPAADFQFQPRQSTEQ